MILKPLYLTESASTDNPINISNNSATYGGAIFIIRGNITINGKLNFNQNKATYERAISPYFSNVKFAGNLTCNNNSANHAGGGMILRQDYTHIASGFSFKNSTGNNNGSSWYGCTGVEIY